MPVKALKRINQRIYYRFTITTIINQSIRYNTTPVLPIPGKKYNNNTNRNTQQHSQSLAHWQQRTITLHDQSYKLPDLIIARIESLSNAKIETLSTTTKQKINTNEDDQEIYGNTSLLSSFYPSEYYQTTISGDGEAVDKAIQIYIHYSQNAIPITLDSKIPDDILDIISKEYGCFIEKQNDFIYRIYPLTLNNQKDKENINRIQQQIRSSIHKLSIPYEWYNSNELMKLLFNYLRKESIRNNLSFKSGGYFWYDRNRTNIENNIIETDINDEFDSIDSILYAEEFKDVGYIWTYQDTQSASVIDIQKELQIYIETFTNKWNFMTLSNKIRSMLYAKQNVLWNYIKTFARNEYNIVCISGKDGILYRKINDKERENEFEDVIQGIFDHIEHIEINVNLTDNCRKKLHRLCADFNLIYIIPNNEAYISYYYNSNFIGKNIKNKNELILKAIKNIIDPSYLPQENIMLNRPKSDQIIKIENSEKYHVAIRMLKYLESKGMIKNINVMREENNDDERSIYYSILQKERSIALSVEGNENEEENNEFIKEKMDEIYECINCINSVSIALPVLLLIKGKSDFIHKFEEKYNVMVSSPPVSGNVDHIINKHKQQKRLFLSGSEEKSEGNSDQIMAKIYFWCINENRYENNKLIQKYFENIVYKCIDIPMPIDILYTAINKDKTLHNEIEVNKYFTTEYNFIGMTKHYMDKKLKIFNPKPNISRYWLFSEEQNKLNMDEFIKDMQTLLDGLEYIELKDMAGLVQHLGLLPKLGKKHKMRSYLSVSNGKLYCFDKNKYDGFKEDLETEISEIKKNNCIGIAGDKYDDIALFLVTTNIDRIKKIIEPMKGFLWINYFEQVLNIYCDNENILKTIENDVIENIYENSKILYWKKHFQMDFNEFYKSSHLQQQFKNIMKQTNTKYAIRKNRPVMPAIAITNYDKYELDNAYKKLLKLLNPNKQIDTSTVDIKQTNALPKPIILS